ncbi:MAG: YcaO-like family protein [Pikeienuella sp.]
MTDQADAERLINALVSKRCGLVTELAPQGRAPAEPCPPYLWNATLTHYDYRNTPLAMRLAGGKGLTETQAKLSALGEALERYSAVHWDNQRVRFGPASDTAILPTDCVLYSDHQYGTSVPYRKWSINEPDYWISGTEFPSNTPVELPAALVYQVSPYARVEDHFTAVTSNGLGAGKNLPDAILSGIYEVIERDAFMITWLNRLPTTKIKTPQQGCNAAQIIRQYEKFGVSVRLLSLATDQAATVVMAIAENPDDESAFRVIGLGCDLDPVTAVDKAVLELCQLKPGAASRAHGNDYKTRLTGYESVRTIDDHILFHLMPEHAAEFDFLTQTNAECDLGDLPRPDCFSTQDALVALIESATKCGSRVAYADITAADFAELGPKVVRVIMTGFQPIHFGFAEGRLGGTRLYEAPVTWGLRKMPLSEAELNQCPHPLA